MRYSKYLSKISIMHWILILLILLGSSWCLASTAVEPSRFIFLAEAGGRVTGTIKVTNTNTRQAEINAIVYDWALNEDGKMVTSQLGTRKETLKNMIKFNPQRFTLGAGESQIVRFTITAPKEGELFERRGIVFFEELLAFNQKGIGANVMTQVGSTIYLSLKGMRMAFGVKNERIEKLPNGNQRAVMEVTNNGNGHIRYSVGYKVINEKGMVVNENGFSENVLLPDTHHNVVLSLPEKLVPGKYNLLLTFAFYGTNQTTSRMIPFVVN